MKFDDLSRQQILSLYSWGGHVPVQHIAKWIGTNKGSIIRWQKLLGIQSIDIEMENKYKFMTFVERAMIETQDIQEAAIRLGYSILLLFEELAAPRITMSFGKFYLR